MQSIADILDDFITKAPKAGECVTAGWINSLAPEDKKRIESLTTTNKNVPVKNVYEVLVATGHKLPMKLTAFRSHFKGYCTCKK
jgi:hypothetical protein